MALVTSQVVSDGQKMSSTLAAKDIVRRNHLGQHVVVVPKGQPIPEGLEVTDTERGIKKMPERLENKASRDRPIPKATSKP
jgi:hypothetical protein